MAKILYAPQDDYRIKVKNTGVITLDTGPDIGVVNLIGLISVDGTTDYETLVVSDDHIPNKKYVVDAIADAVFAPADRTHLTDGTTTLYVHDLGAASNLQLTLHGVVAGTWTASSFTFQNFNVAGSSISGTATDTDITLSANGTGQIYLNDTVKIGGNPVIVRANTVGATVNLFDTTTGAFEIGNLSSSVSIGSDITSAQTIEIGASSTGISTYNFATGPTTMGLTRTVNIGTNGQVGSTTNVNIGGYGDGIIMLSPIGIRFKLTISNDGLYTVTALDSLIGLILKSPDGTRYGLNTTNGGLFQVVPISPDPFVGATIKTTSSVFEITTYGAGLMIDSPNGTVYKHSVNEGGNLLVESYSSETISGSYVIEITTAGEGITMFSPLGVKYKITVTNGGLVNIASI